MVALIPKEKCLLLLKKTTIFVVSSTVGYLLGPLVKSTADGAQDGHLDGAPFTCIVTQPSMNSILYSHAAHNMKDIHVQKLGWFDITPDNAMTLSKNGLTLTI